MKFRFYKIVMYPYHFTNEETNAHRSSDLPSGLAQVRAYIVLIPKSFLLSVLLNYLPEFSTQAYANMTAFSQEFAIYHKLFGFTFIE